MSGKRFVVLYDYPETIVENAWRDCLAVGDLPTHFAAPEYFHEPTSPGEKRFAILALDPHSASLRVTGILTGVRVGNSVRSGQIGTPQTCFDKAADASAITQALLEGLSGVTKGANLVTVYTWNPVACFRNAGFSETQETGTAALDISAGAEKTFRKLKGRSQIRHAMSAGVEVRHATSADLPAYYAILKGWSERKELPCPSFEVVTESFRLTTNRLLFVALHEGQIIAGTPVRFYRGATAEYAWNVSLPESQHLRPNDLLHWRIIEWACDQGIHTYLLGATHAFLLKYSDRIIPTYRYTKDLTLFRQHTLKQKLSAAAVSIYRSLPSGLKEKLKRFRDKR